MILNTQIFTEVIEAAKAKCAGNAALLRAIDRAAVEIQKAPYWSFADGVLTLISSTSGERYVINDSHACPARSKTCKHLVARRLMQRYFERLAMYPVGYTPAAVTVITPIAADRAQLIADVQAAWRKARPFAAINEPIRQVFGVSRLDALTNENLKQIADALRRPARV